MSSEFNAPNINPFTPGGNDPDPQTIPIDEIIRNALQGFGLQLRVSMPAQITVIQGPQKVTVQPLLQARYITGEIVNIPPIQNVFVQFPAGQNYSIKLPISVGDTGNLLFADRSLDVWMSGSGGIVDPQDSRSHFIQDAVFYPGLTTFQNANPDTTTDMVLTNGTAQMRLFQTGGFKIQNLGANQELILNLITLVTTLSTASTVAGGPFVSSVITELEQLIENLQTLAGG